MAPRSEVLNQRMRGESRAKIVEHALRLFAEHGYDRTSVKMIAESAGIAQGLLYNYFESKEHLLREIFAQSMRDVHESVTEAEAADTPEERIERLVRASFQVLRRNQQFWRLSYGVRMQAPVLAALGDEVLHWAETIRATLEGYFNEAGVDVPAVEAAILFALIDGVSQHYVLDPESYPLDEVIERVVASYRRGGDS
ncbi:MAG: TetR/AcrR family transcriptional regulator [Longimicrobiaceae bacterium]